MRLRSLTKHLREQNWFAVGLDFIIVVTGILIAFQITNWNEARGQRLDAAVVLERLHEDFQIILGQTERSLARHEGYIEATARVIKGARTGDYVEESLLEDLQLVGDFSVPSGPSATYAELVASGRLKLIDNEELRRSLKSYDDYVTLVRSEYGIFTDSLTQTRDVLLRAQMLEASGVPIADLDNLSRVIKADRDLLSDDLQIKNQLQIAYAVQNNIYAILYRNRGEILKIIEMIEEEME